MCFFSLDIFNIDKCVEKCKMFCQLKINVLSLSYIAIFMGIFYFLSICLLLFVISEKECRKPKSMSLTSLINDSIDTSPYFIPSLYQMTKNIPFLYIIVPWILDVSIMTIFATMMPFYLNFVINPQKYCMKHYIDLSQNICKVNVWYINNLSKAGLCYISFLYCLHFQHDLLVLFCKLVWEEILLETLQFAYGVFVCIICFLH